MLSKEQLDKLTKPELVKYVLSLQDVKETLRQLDNTVTGRLESIEGKIIALDEFKNTAMKKMEQLEGELVVAKNANDLLRGELDKRTEVLHKKLSDIERTTYRSAEYANYETLEVSNIPASIPTGEVAGVVLAVINALDSTAEDFDINDVHAIHRRQNLLKKKSSSNSFDEATHISR